MRGLEGPISSQEDLIVSRAWVWCLAARSGKSHQPLCSSEGSEALFCPLQALRSCVRMNSHTLKETKIDFFFKSYRFRYALEKWGLGVRRGTFHGVSRSEGVILACGPGPASSSCVLWNLHVLWFVYFVWINYNIIKTLAKSYIAMVEKHFPLVVRHIIVRLIPHRRVNRVPWSGQSCQSRPLSQVTLNCIEWQWTLTRTLKSNHWAIHIQYTNFHFIHTKE